MSTSIVSASGVSVKGELITWSIARLAAAIASSRNCMLDTERKFDVLRTRAEISMIVISTSMIRPTTSAAPLL